ncbi:unnamed protein product [Didymodactylos carnosus]|uniref:ADP ribosyltransferase domain-containing protein n=1 Tax=Didymodactylos carnosus TaxID=1234261 RepID=A0A814Q3L8_9BILA|nr:unnamed protein product [Didymodactylos carnosus]CAF3878048.1 unnamed protein product [Didymodactylos carnosus]
MIFSFRFFMNELSKQVTELYNPHRGQNLNDNNAHIIHVYHGQAIAKEELKQMQQGIGGFISINSFFSTSRSETKAKSFAKEAKITEHIRRILWRITIDCCLPTKTYADIERFSFYKTEKEILFIKDDFELKEVFAYMKKDIGDETSMVSLGNILVQMGEYDKAE